MDKERKHTPPLIVLLENSGIIHRERGRGKLVTAKNGLIAGTAILFAVGLMGLSVVPKQNFPQQTSQSEKAYPFPSPGLALTPDPSASWRTALIKQALEQQRMKYCNGSYYTDESFCSQKTDGLIDQVPAGVRP